MDQHNQPLVALVTGASAGIGRETVKLLLSKGLVVYAAARRVEMMKELANLGARLIRMDIVEASDRMAAVDHISKESGGVDILVNNAGFGTYGAMEDVNLNDVRYQFEVNLFGLGHLTQLVLPGMREKGKGRIINISSMGGKVYTPMGSWYYASKHALEGWSDTLRLEVKPFGIDVVIIEPGIIYTEFGDVAVKPMMERSGHTAYRPLALKMEKAMQRSYTPKGSTPPENLAKVIVRAALVSRPRTRYVAGKMARLSICSRKLLPDRWFDKMVMVLS